jgi:hypothetical protein
MGAVSSDGAVFINTETGSVVTQTTKSHSMTAIDAVIHVFTILLVVDFVF